MTSSIVGSTLLMHFILFGILSINCCRTFSWKSFFTVFRKRVGLLLWWFSVFLSISVINNIKFFKSEFEGQYLLFFPADLISGSDVILHTIDVNSLSDIRRLLLEGHQHVTGLIIKTWTLTGRDEEETVMRIKLINSYCLVHVYAGDEGEGSSTDTTGCSGTFWQFFTRCQTPSLIVATKTGI